ncbi:MAG: hypothetical protein FJX47_01315 [Alphaproteobacteria bacterium]|nr:hypothetical protein [Alphaproteobacteria bacterium]
MRRMIEAIERALGEERRYLKTLEARGDFAAVKLAAAAIAEVEAGLRQARSENAADAARLSEIFWERRRAFTEAWDDPDGVGTSTFTRVLRLVDGGAQP